MKINEILTESTVDEMALPAHWDESMLGHDKTFKSRLQYALDNAPRLGGGSSRVAFTIEDNGRPTVLKVAKNRKGVAQNEAEIDILNDGYLGRLPIVIPLIDYDKKNSTPYWLQTEKAEKINETRLCQMLKCTTLVQFCGYVKHMLRLPSGDMWKNVPRVLSTKFNEQDVEQFIEYASEMADLINSSGLLIADFQHASNWGVYNNRPVVIDLGFNQSVAGMYI